ncbi:hypothetical protein EB796_022584 [Bugula neritina]|uniref:Uncharacterized protein n=1 Tax=Bugula neritina TaxID=10212 RepID=A0A7J7IZV0_BUGNE|nr:hypothetical protein EB796_022584 [Bugula neritina]
MKAVQHDLEIQQQKLSFNKKLLWSCKQQFTLTQSCRDGAPGSPGAPGPKGDKGASGLAGLEERKEHKDLKGPWN